MTRKNHSNEIHITRLYNAPIRAVWNAWTDPEQVAQWWGPRGFTITTHSKDLKPGGHWVYTMHGPDGTDYPNSTLYHEVEECSRLVYDHGANDEKPPLFRVTVLFSEEGNKTKMDMTMTLPTPEAAEEARKFVKKAGGNATWDRLAEYLEKSSTGKELFVINRSFNVPLDLIYDMWTNPKHICQWLPSSGFNMEFIRIDVSVGGSAFYVMTGENNEKLFGKTNYLKLQKPSLLTYTQQFCDENENISRHPKVPTWPQTMHVTVTFTDEGQNSTRVSVVSECHGDFTLEELKTFMGERTGMTGGWTNSFDKLEEYISNKRN